MSEFSTVLDNTSGLGRKDLFRVQEVPTTPLYVDLSML
jgi:hypothetical protein